MKQQKNTEGEHMKKKGRCCLDWRGHPRIRDLEYSNMPGGEWARQDLLDSGSCRVIQDRHAPTEKHRWGSR